MYIDLYQCRAPSYPAIKQTPDMKRARDDSYRPRPGACSNKVLDDDIHDYKCTTIYTAENKISSVHVVRYPLTKARYKKVLL